MTVRHWVKAWSPAERAKRVLWVSNAGISFWGIRTYGFSVKLEVFGPLVYIMESLILAQNERWRRVLSMQVVRQGGATRPRAADW